MAEILKEWHWYFYHFNNALRGVETPFARSIIDALLKCECAQARLRA
jgi:hypothetical protein